MAAQGRDPEPRRCPRAGYGPVLGEAGAEELGGAEGVPGEVLAGVGVLCGLGEVLAGVGAGVVGGFVTVVGVKVCAWDRCRLACR
jgi:hypothetical protein